MSEVLLPGNSTAQERALEQTTARAGDVPVLVREIWNADAAPSQTLPWLAWAFSVDEWNSGWTDDQKRAAIQASIAIHKRKGTIGAVRRALASLDYGARVQEWFAQLPAGTAYTFRLLLEADQTGWSLEELRQVITLVEAVKNLRSHLEEVAPSVVSTLPASAGAVSFTGHGITLDYFGPAVLNAFVIVAE